VRNEQLEIDPQPKLSTCRSCRRSIIWTRTERGKKMPLDADPVTNHDQSGLFVLREMERNDGPLALAAWGLEGTEPHYLCHFATCPNADAHRSTNRRTENVDQPPQDPGWRPAGRKYRSSAR
jgi:hypothetical protein